MVVNLGTKDGIVVVNRRNKRRTESWEEQCNDARLRQEANISDPGWQVHGIVGR